MQCNNTLHEHVMAFSIPTAALLSLFLLAGAGAAGIPGSDVDLLEFPLNLEYLEAEFFSWGAFGRGLDAFEPNLTKGGPPPLGVKKANLTPLIEDIIAQFAFQEFGHLRAIQQTVSGFPRPLLNLSAASFATVMNSAVGKALVPPFDPYASDINYLLASYVIPYVGLTGYVGANPKLISPISKRLVAGLLGVESGQDAVIRALLYQRAMTKVHPYGYTVAELTDKISALRNKLGDAGIKDEGLIVEPSAGAEGRIAGNVLAGDENSLAYDRTPEQILRIVYASGKETQPGGFYPKGASGNIARSYLRRKA
ncbi:desiccation-related protein PCC13-62-like [Salvia miltiorrhiza]|uniref:desiccation-related protein PCC13-62-like n=1 Tax=Salvia miltiorrhiza TaxID=226208 RepID=UPI0025AD83C5|nr:desiccation-related protein PCC13-62-like [Salvia miltiorrhiza]